MEKSIDGNCFSRTKRSDIFGSFNDYSKQSTIHSISYIGKKNIHWLERLFWILAFGLSLSSCCYLMYRTFDKWEREPVLVSFNERLTPISQIPFPAITFCGPSPYHADQFNTTKVFEKGKQHWMKLDSLEKEKLLSLDTICDNSRSYEHNDTNANHIDTLISIANGFGSMSLMEAAFCQGHCSFLGAFANVMTERGVCRTINMLDQADLYTDEMEPRLRLPNHGVRSNWTVYGYDDKTNIFAFPVRSLGSGIKNGLELKLRIVKQDIDNGRRCFNSPSTFYMALHSPDEIPQLRSNFFKVSFDVLSTIVVQPKVTSTTDNLKSYLPKQRQCFFENEKKLHFFKSYSQSKCLIECLADYVQQECGCIPVYMPHETGTEICKNLSCFKKSEKMWNFYMTIYLFKESLTDKADNDEHSSERKDLEMDEKSYENLLNISLEAADYQKEFARHQSLNKILQKKMFSEITDKAKVNKVTGVVRKPSCDCLPACNSINYEAVVSHLNYGSFEPKDADQSSIITIPIEIYQKDDYFIEIKRSELYNWINFLSSCGGFLGLLMGASFISLLEIIYHFGLKTFFRNIKRSNVQDITVSVPIDQ